MSEQKKRGAGEISIQDSLPVIEGFEITTKNEKGYKSFAQDIAKKNPFVPIGVLCTCAALVFGVRAMTRGDRWQSQLMMRYRVGFQAFTIAAIVGSIVAAGMSDDKNKNDDDD